MKREFLKGLELDKETIDTIMSEHGKSITGAKEELEALKNEKKSLETKIDELGKNSKDSSKIQEELDTLKKGIEEETNKRKLEDADKVLSNNIETSFGEKKFVNEYTKKQIANDIKEALKDANNVGRSAKEIFEEITKDKEGIFKNPNEVVKMEKNNNVEKGVADEAKMMELIGLTPEK